MWWFCRKEKRTVVRWHYVLLELSVSVWQQTKLSLQGSDPAAWMWSMLAHFFLGRIKCEQNPLPFPFTHRNEKLSCKTNECCESRWQYSNDKSYQLITWETAHTCSTTGCGFQYIVVAQRTDTFVFSTKLSQAEVAIVTDSWLLEYKDFSLVWIHRHTVKCAYF